MRECCDQFVARITLKSCSVNAMEVLSHLRSELFEGCNISSSKVALLEQRIEELVYQRRSSESGGSCNSTFCRRVIRTGATEAVEMELRISRK